MPKITFFDSKPYDREFFEACNQNYGFELKFFAHHLNSDTAGLALGSDAVCVFVNDRCDAAVIEALYGMGIRLIALRCAGYNNVDLRAAWERINVLRVPGYSPNAVAEHAVALLLTLNRKTHRAYFRTRDNNFSIAGLLGFDLKEKHAGIIGAGRIGLALIQILRGFGMRVMAYDANPRPELAAQMGFSYVELPELFAQSDVISLHCPLTPETRHLINAESLALMKPGVVIINTGRGQLIDTQALIGALKSRKIGGAGLDVYEEESEYFFEDFSDSFIPDDVLARLLSFNNVLLTSHQGFFTKEAMQSIATVTMQNIKDFFEGKDLQNEICYHCGNPDCPPKPGGRCF
ncbi:MAG: 2-hydroxyacid dehydrogenase [Lentisphaerae bacterium]|jgi:D-lactate dehydrogenase|nr:2-hydroxyacid dehydrogenase [Lentisphaerota bacterium]